MAEEEHRMTLREAARYLGVPAATVLHWIQEGELNARMERGPRGGQCYLDRREVFEARRRLLPAGEEGLQKADAGERALPGRVTDMVPVEVHILALQRLEETERALRLAERRLGALAYELTFHRRALTENAESLAEKEARSREAEKRLAELTTLLQEASREAQRRRRRELDLEAQVREAERERRLRDRLEHRLELLKRQVVEAEGKAARERNRWQRLPGWVRWLWDVG